MSRASAAIRLGLMGVATAATFFVACSTPWQRIAASAELLTAWPTTAHWRVPVGSIQNLQPAANVVAALSAYPQVGESTKLLALESLLFAAFLWALLYGVLRHALWTPQEADVRRIGHGPRLNPTYPEAPWVRSVRRVLLIAVGLTALFWLISARA